MNPGPSMTFVHLYKHVCTIIVLTVAAIPLQAMAKDSLFKPSHTPWVSSADGRDIRCTLLVTPLGETDAYELAHQASWNERIFVVTDENEKVESTFKKSLNTTDVLIITQAAWDIVSPATQTTIIDKLNKGIGLVLFSEKADLTFIDSLEMSALPIELKPGYSMPLRIVEETLGFQFATFKNEHNRVVQVEHHSPSFPHTLIPIEHIDEVKPKIIYDYRIGTIIRAVQWSANKKTSLGIESIIPPDTTHPDPSIVPPQIPPEFLEYMLDSQMPMPTTPIKLKLTRPSSKSYSIDVRMRQPHRDLDFSFTQIDTFPKEQDTHTFHIPILKGEVWMDVWLRDGLDIIDWHSIELQQESWPKLTKVEFSKRRVNPTDLIEANFYVRPNRFTPKSTYAYMLIRNQYDRVINTKRLIVTPQGGEFSISMNWNDIQSQTLRVELYLNDNSRGLSEWGRRTGSYAFADLTVKQPLAPTLQWGIEGEILDEPALAKKNQWLHQTMGAKHLHVPSSGIPHDLTCIAHVNAFPQILNPDSAKQKLCYSSQEFREDQYTHLERWLFRHPPDANQVIALTSPKIDSINSHLSTCDSDSCLEYLQKQLKSLYPTVDVLNEYWGTQFSHWEDIRVPKNIPLDSPPWFNIHTIEEQLFNETIRHAHQQLSNYTVKQPIGIKLSTTETTPFSHHWSDLLSNAEWIDTPNNHLLIDKIGSFRSKAALTNISLTPDDFIQSPQWLWHALLLGTNSLSIGDSHGQDEAIEVVAQEYRTIPHGVRSLIQASTPAPASVAIYENNNARIHALADENNRLMHTQNAAISTLQSLGIQYQFVSFGQMLDDTLKNFPLLMLLQIDSLSLEEEAFLIQYDKGGGTILADQAPGKLDEHGRTVSEKRPLMKHITQIDISDEQSLDNILKDNPIERLHPNITKTSASSFRWFNYRYGKATLYGLIAKNPKKHSPPSLSIPNPLWAFDILKDETTDLRYRQENLRPKINNRGAGLFVTLPYRVSRILLDAPAEALIGQRLYFKSTLKTYDALPGDHLLAVRLLDSQGNSIPYYETVIEHKEGETEATGFIPLAHNEPLGVYALEVRDVLTGTIALHPFRVVNTLTPETEGSPKSPSAKSVFSK